MPGPVPASHKDLTRSPAGVTICRRSLRESAMHRLPFGRQVRWRGIYRSRRESKNGSVSGAKAVARGWGRALPSTGSMWRRRLRGRVSCIPGSRSCLLPSPTRQRRSRTRRAALTATYTRVLIRPTPLVVGRCCRAGRRGPRFGPLFPSVVPYSYKYFTEHGTDVLSRGVNQVFSGLTVIIIGQEETTTTSDPSTATLLHIRLPRQNSASTDSSRAGEKSPGVPGFGHAKGPLIRGRHGPTRETVG
jgi:hypothetical protein